MARTVAVRLILESQGYIQGADAVAKKTREMGSEAEKLAQKKEAFNVLGTAAVGVGVAMTAATALSVKAAMDWESAWAGVTKTVDGTDAQMARVEEGLRGLTAVLPASHEQIAAVAEAAGQLGIQTDNVVSFTQTMIDLGETTNLSANDAATALARFTNIMGTSQDEVDNLGSALVGLGNNYATTEAEIMEMSMRLAGAGKQIGLSEGDVLGLATALSSVGIEAEAGGSAMSKVMIDIAASVEEGGDRLEMFAKTAGVSAEQFAARWRSDPAAALSMFVKGLANAESQGASTLGVLSELGITEVRMRDALLRSASAADQFSAAMADGNQAFDENNALTIEAAKRYETVESKIAIAGNAIRDTAIDFGQVFLPAVGAAAEAVGVLAQFLGDLPDPVQGALGAMTGVVGVIALVGGTALLAVPKIAEFRVAMQTLGISIRAVGVIGGGAMVALTALVTVVGLVASAQAEAQQRAQSYADTLAEGTNKVTSATREMVKEALAAKNSFLWMEQDSAYDAAEKLGISFDLVTDAAMGNAGALKELQRQIDAGADGSLAYANSAVDIENAVKGEADSIERATELAEQKQKADLESAASAGTAAEAYQQQADVVADLTSELTGLIDTINEANGIGQDAVSTNARYQEALAGISEEVQRQKDAYEEANGTLDGFVLSLDESTASGSANASMLADVAGRAQDAAAAQFEVDKTTMSAEDATKKYSDTLAAQRQAFIDSAVQAGYNAGEVQKLADKVFALPSAKEIEILAETAAAQDQVNSFITMNNGRQIRIKVAADGGSIQMGTFNVTPSATGNLFVKGAKVTDFAAGGWASGVGMFPATPGGLMRVVEAGHDEAVISTDPKYRSRSMRLVEEMAGRLGMLQPGSYRAAPVVNVAAPSLDGMSISGTLDLGNGLTGFVNGVVSERGRAVASGVRNRKWNDA